MEKAYKNIVLFFIAVTVIVFLGFYPTYYSFFPAFEGFQTFHHVHGVLMVLWLFVLIAQPVLINRKAFRWHRAIGKISYILVPMIVVSMVVAYRYAFLTAASDNGVADGLTRTMLFLPLTDILPFAAFYLLAVIYRKQIGRHLRFMIATAVVVVSAGLLRLIATWLGMDFMGALYASVGAMALVFVALIFYDYKNGQLARNRSFVTALIIFSIPNLLLLFVPYTSWWLAVVEGVAS